MKLGDQICHSLNFLKQAFFGGSQPPGNGQPVTGQVYQVQVVVRAAAAGGGGRLKAKYWARVFVGG